ncbi:MAG: hypothetical protein ACI9U2_003255 [Bradymonadia bacterium]|jgi:hypothetical protein
MESLRSVMLLGLVLGSTLARAAEPTGWQTSLTLVAEVLEIAGDGNVLADNLPPDGWLEEALMDWRFFDGGWTARGHDELVPNAPDFARPLKRISHSNRSARSAVLMVAEIWRTDARTAMDLLMAYMLVQGLRSHPATARDADDAFRPTRDDERRLLTLGLRRLHTLVKNDNHPLSAALRAKFDRGREATLMREFEDLPELDWSEALVALFAPRDEPSLGQWAIHAGAFVRLREVRVEFMGLTDQSID